MYLIGSLIYVPFMICKGRFLLDKMQPMSCSERLPPPSQIPPFAWLNPASAVVLNSAGGGDRADLITEKY